MASLTFNKEGGNWVAYFKAEADFALHIERDEAGVMSMEQSTTGGGYAVVEDFPARARYGRAFDYEFSALLYPKFIRIASASEPTFAEVVSNGEITEIKAQSKEVEVTANGTMDITPDAGFSYLNSVKVKTNVAQSGGGGGSASSWRYFSMAGLSASDKASVAAVVMVAKGVNPQDNSITILTPAAASMLGVGYDVFGFDANVRIIMSGIEMTLGESFDAHPLKDKITEITEEEFYNIA